jgi:hypothetical protein
MPGLGELMVIGVAFLVLTQFRGASAGTQMVQEHASWTLRTVLRRILPSWVPLPSVRRPDARRAVREVVEGAVRSDTSSGRGGLASDQAEVDS